MGSLLTVDSKMLKELAKNLTPPIMLKASRDMLNSHRCGYYSGPYPTWDNALSKSTRYDDNNIVQACKQAVLKTKQIDAAFERDGCVISDRQFAYPLMSLVGQLALSKKPLQVLDFGGGLASSFSQAQVFYKNNLAVKWHIVEQPSFCKAGLELFKDENLCFFESLEEAMVGFKPDLLLLSGVLQCLESPIEWLKTFSKLKIPYWIIDRVPLTPQPQHRIVIQNAPQKETHTSYPIWLFSEARLKSELAQLGIIEDTFPALDSLMDTIKWQIHYEGFYLKTTSSQ